MPAPEARPVLGPVELSGPIRVIRVVRGRFDRLPWSVCWLRGDLRNEAIIGVIAVSAGGGFFGAPLTDDSIMAFAVPARP